MSKNKTGIYRKLCVFFRLCKVFKLWAFYVFYICTFQKVKLITIEGIFYWIHPEAIRGLQMNLDGVRFDGAINGICIEFRVSLDKIDIISGEY